MKQYLFLLFIIFAISLKATDSTQYTINVTARDCEYIAAKVVTNQDLETVWDTLKVKFRVANPPSGATNVSVTAYGIDWTNLLALLNGDLTVVNNNVYKRVSDALTALNQAYLNAAITKITDGNNAAISDIRKYGRYRLTRKQ